MINALGFCRLKQSDMAFYAIINVKMPTSIVVIITLMSRIHFKIRSVKNENKFYSLKALFCDLGDVELTK